MCGIFGIYSNQVGEKCWFGNYFNQHRGQRYGGIAIASGNKICYVSHRGRMDHKFPITEAQSIRGELGISHVSLKDRQPYALIAGFGQFALGFDGRIINIQELIDEMGRNGRSISLEQSTVEVIARLIGEGKDVVDGIKKMNDKIKGSFSLVILTPNEIFIARDSYGFRPLILGQDNDVFAVSSESRALQNLNLEIFRDVKPGEIINLNRYGFETVGQLPVKRVAHCAFEWAYIASIDSIIDGIPVITVRHRLGEKLAKRDNDQFRADFCSPIPMSGIGHCEGYSLASGLTNSGSWLYNRYADRSYTPLEQTERDWLASVKLSVMKAIVKNKKIVIVDDSIVRGTQIREQIKRLKIAGAQKIHLRIACPPLMSPCDFSISTMSYQELIATSKSIQQICEFVGADSLVYNTLDDFVSAIGLPADQLCLKCWTNKSPLAA
ncbi:MAG: hypothetical protein V1684_00115 [bacterium]